MGHVELREIRIFDVLRNSLNGELGVVMKITGDHLALRIKTGAVIRYKFGKHFERIDGNDAVDFRAAVRDALKATSPDKPKRRRTLSGFLSRLAKKS